MRRQWIPLAIKPHLTGTAEPGSTVCATNGEVTWNGQTGANGQYSITIPKQLAGTMLNVWGVDATGNTSDQTTVTVKDATPPSAPKVDAVTDQTTTLTGTAEPGATIIVTNGSDKWSGQTGVNGQYSIMIPKQTAGTTLTITATDAAGNVSVKTNVKVNDGTAPVKPTVNGVSDADISVSGHTEAKAKVTVKSGNTVIGSAATDSKGAFKVTIPKQKASTILTVYAEDTSGNKSDVTTVTVTDATPPSAPTVDTVSDQTTLLTGTAEPGTTINVTNGKDKWSGQTGVNGQYSITIPRQKAGTTLTIITTDAAGNVSAKTNAKVNDGTAPVKPTVNGISDADTSVSGHTEANAKVMVKSGNTVIGSATADSKGTFKVKIPKQKTGTKLTVYVKDSSGNKSAETIVTVSDITAPAKPTIYTLGDNQTNVTGKAEAGSKVIIKSGKTILGQGTTGSNGTFSIKIKSKQTAGTTLTAYAIDKVGNQSSTRLFKVVDKTPPATPSVDKLTAKSTTKVIGKAEKGAIVYVYNGSKYLGKTSVNSKGQYSVGISKQKKGSTLKIYAKDKSGNTGNSKYVRVQ
ncbi:Ig-like domain-containing protein [Terrilactibacillus sp. S3-3]|nr:Ig-like domain-containing protein [Terrilactibacillus sp. S3-3]